MPGPNIPVNPGPPTILQANIGANTLIQNTDSVNSVWVSSSSAVAPGNGTEIGALGNVTWSTANATVWACVDTGVTTPVQVSLNPDVVNPNNPVAEGAAIAAILIEEGITVNATEDILDSEAGPISLAANKIISNLALAGYNSLKLAMQITGKQYGATGSTNDLILVRIDFKQSPTGPVIGRYQYFFWGTTVLPTLGLATAGFLAASDNFPLINVPALASFATITIASAYQANGSGGPTTLENILVTGSSRQVDRPICTTLTDTQGMLLASNPTPAHTTYNFYLPTVQRCLQRVTNGTAAATTFQLNTNSFPLSAAGSSQQTGRVIDFGQVTSAEQISPLLFTNSEAPTASLVNSTAAVASVNYSVIDTSDE